VGDVRTCMSLPLAAVFEAGKLLLHRVFRSSEGTRILKDGLWVLASSFIVAAAGLVSIRVFTELAPKDIFGEANLFLGVLALGASTFISPITSAQLRFHGEYDLGGRSLWFTHEISRLTLAASLLLGVLLVMGIMSWGMFRGRLVETSIVFFLVILLLVNAQRNLRISRLNAERRQVQYAVWSAAEAVLIAACTALALWSWTSVGGFLLGQVSGMAIALGIFGWLLYPGHREQKIAETSAVEDRKLFMRKLLAYGLPFIPMSMMTWASNLGDRYILAGMVDSAAVGQYVAVFAIASRPVLMIASVLNDNLRPVMFDAVNASSTAKTSLVFRGWIAVTLVVGSGILLGYWIAGDWIIQLLLASEYRQGAFSIMMWVVFGYVVYSLILVFENRLLALEQSRRLILPQFAGAVVNVLLSIILIPKTGIVGAAQANAASFCAQLGVTALVLVIVLNKHKSQSQPI